MAARSVGTESKDPVLVHNECKFTVAHLEEKFNQTHFIQGNSDIFKHICQLALSGNIVGLAEFLKCHDPDTLVFIKEGSVASYTPAGFLARYYGTDTAVKLLVRRGANPNGAAIGAAEGNRLNLVQWLVAEGAHTQVIYEGVNRCINPNKAVKEFLLNRSYYSQLDRIAVGKGISCSKQAISFIGTEPYTQCFWTPSYFNEKDCSAAWVALGKLTPQGNNTLAYILSGRDNLLQPHHLSPAALNICATQFRRDVRALKEIDTKFWYLLGICQGAAMSGDRETIEACFIHAREVGYPQTILFVMHCFEINGYALTRSWENFFNILMMNTRAYHDDNAILIKIIIPDKTISHEQHIDKDLLLFVLAEITRAGVNFDILLNISRIMEKEFPLEYIAQLAASSGNTEWLEKLRHAFPGDEVPCFAARAITAENINLSSCPARFQRSVNYLKHFSHPRVHEIFLREINRHLSNNLEPLQDRNSELQRKITFIFSGMDMNTELKAVSKRSSEKTRLMIEDYQIQNHCYLGSLSFWVQRNLAYLTLLLTTYSEMKAALTKDGINRLASLDLIDLVQSYLFEGLPFTTSELWTVKKALVVNAMQQNPHAFYFFGKKTNFHEKCLACAAAPTSGALQSEIAGIENTFSKRAFFKFLSDKTKSKENKEYALFIDMVRRLDFISSPLRAIDAPSYELKAGTTPAKSAWS